MSKYLTAPQLLSARLEGQAENFNQLVRSHWNIENHLHWSLDVQFGEDASRKQIKNAAQNFFTI